MPTDPCLIGRGRELSQLRQALTEESAPAAVLSGAPGIGKTALIDQLCAHAIAHDWRVVRALGVQVEPGPPTG